MDFSGELKNIRGLHWLDAGYFIFRVVRSTKHLEYLVPVLCRILELLRAEVS